MRLALDDFGTGYSSLSYLRSFPLDILKIAKPFVDGVTGRREERSFVRLIVELASTLGLEVVAEGIESADQLEALREMGCDLGQGFHLSPAALHLEHRGAGAHTTTVQKLSRRSCAGTIDLARAAVRRANPSRGGDAKPGASPMEAAQPPARRTLSHLSDMEVAASNALRTEHRLPYALDGRHRAARDRRRPARRSLGLARRAARRGLRPGRRRSHAVADAGARRHGRPHARQARRGDRPAQPGDGPHRRRTARPRARWHGHA